MNEIMKLQEAKVLYHMHYSDFGVPPTRWFISRKTWDEFLMSQDCRYFDVYYAGQNSKLLDLPVYIVVQDGIFECH